MRVHQGFAHRPNRPAATTRHPIVAKHAMREYKAGMTDDAHKRRASGINVTYGNVYGTYGIVDEH